MNCESCKRESNGLSSRLADKRPLKLCKTCSWKQENKTLYILISTTVLMNLVNMIIYPSVLSIFAEAFVVLVYGTIITQDRAKRNIFRQPSKFDIFPLTVKRRLKK